MKEKKRHTVNEISDLRSRLEKLEAELRESHKREKGYQQKLKELVQQENMLNNLLNSIPDAIYFKDLKSRFIKISKYLSNKHGLTDPEQALGQTDFDVFSHEHAQQAYNDEQRVIKTGQIAEIEEVETWHDGRRTWASTHKAPLYDAEGKIIGTMGISRDITRRKQMEAELHRLAHIDGLTGISNRRVFDETLEREWHRAKRGHSPISLIMIDIDDFKAYNDHYGHLAGDDCLKQVAGILKARLGRPGDLLARYGGEEFVAILTNTDPIGAAIAAEDIRNQIERLNIPHKTSRVRDHITISLGIAGSIPSGYLSPEKMLLAADNALYTAKQKGRNQISFANF